MCFVVAAACYLTANEAAAGSPNLLPRVAAVPSASADSWHRLQAGRESDMGGHAGRHSYSAGGDRVEEGDAEGSEGDAGSGAPLKWHQIPNVRS